MNFNELHNKLMNEANLDEGIGKTIGKGLLTLALGVSTPSARAEKKAPQKIEQSAEKKSSFKNAILLKLAKKYIGKHEGISKKIYKDSKGLPTIGIGHLIKHGEDFSKGITDKQVQELFNKDIQAKLKLTKRLFPKFDKYIPSVQVVLLDGVYRGDISGSPKTIKLINKGEWIKASEEYLANTEYKAADKSGSGVAKRMRENAKYMKQYGEHLNKRK